MQNIKTFTYNNLCKKMNSQVSSDYLAKQVERGCERVSRKDIDGNYGAEKDANLSYFEYKGIDCIIDFVKVNGVVKEFGIERK